MKAAARPGPRPVWAAGVAVCALAALAACLILGAKQPFGYDLWAYVLAAEHLVAGEPLYPPYRVSPYGPLGEYHYPPLTAAPFAVLLPLPFWLATAVFMGVLAGVAVAMGVALIRPLPRDARPWAAAAYVLFLPTLLEIALGNLNLMTVALCLLAWSQRRRAAVAGALLAVAIGVKLLPATLVLFYLAAGRIRVALWTAGAGAAGLLLTAVLVPGDLARYVDLLIGLRESSFVSEVLAGTPPAELAAPLGAARALLPPLALAAAVLGGLAARRARDDETHLHHLALAFAPYLAAFAVLWHTYLIAALPLLASTLGRGLASPRPAVRAAIVAGVAASWVLMQVVKNADLVPIAAHLGGLLLLGLLAVAALALERRPASA